MSECKKLCVANESCTFISHFGNNSLHLRNHCMLFSSCETLGICSDCYSEDKRCFNSCDAKLKTENIDALQIITDVPDEPTCLDHCQGNPACRFFTYDTTRDVNINTGMCTLQSELSGPLQPCQHCRTGVLDCRNSTGLCFFSTKADTRLVTSYMVNKTGLTIVNIFALGNCELTVVAVGGGAWASLGGGGSGYVNHTTTTVSSSQLVVRVGGPYEDGYHGRTSVEGEGQTIITAQPGGGSSYANGGPGYSGGGGWGDGGYNGGDGHNGSCGDDGPCNGGRGSGLNISSIAISFLLTPGQGGRQNGGDGGGGGGVMVDQTGPQSTDNAGQGYGRGGGGDNGQPGPGLVLLEFKPQQ